MTQRIVVGTLSGAFGVHGDVRLKSFCADPEAIADYSPLTTEDGEIFQQIVISGRQKNGLVARIDGVTTKEQADALNGTKLYAQRDALPSLPDDEFYHADLIGLSVHDTGGNLLGTVKDVMNNGAEDLLEIISPKHSDTVFLPFSRLAVPTVDLAAKRIVADPPDGLF